MSDKTGGPAFPAQPTHHMSGSISITSHHGMTLRDYFAAKAMANCPMNDDSDAAHWCYKRADAMLAERDK